jgi:hypothetical protein
MNQFVALSKGGVKNVFINQRFFEPIFPIHAEYVQPKKEDNMTGGNGTIWSPFSMK